jgi:hypothetical protein
MIFGAHVLVYGKDPEADRAFFRNVLGVRYADAGHGWLIFKLPPSEMAVHPTGNDAMETTHAGHRLLGAVLYLMSDDLRGEIATLKSKGVQCTEIDEAPWGIKTTIKLPSGGEIGLYQPTHVTALDL